MRGVKSGIVAIEDVFSQRAFIVLRENVEASIILISSANQYYVLESIILTSCHLSSISLKTYSM